jgi:hypothetical protein
VLSEIRVIQDVLIPSDGRPTLPLLSTSNAGQPRNQHAYELDPIQDDTGTQPYLLGIYREYPVGHATVRPL